MNHHFPRNAPLAMLVLAATFWGPKLRADDVTPIPKSVQGIPLVFRNIEMGATCVITKIFNPTDEGEDDFKEPAPRDVTCADYADSMSKSAPEHYSYEGETLNETASPDEKQAACIQAQAKELSAALASPAFDRLKKSLPASDSVLCKFEEKVSYSDCADEGKIEIQLKSFRRKWQAADQKANVVAGVYQPSYGSTGYDLSQHPFFNTPYMPKQKRRIFVQVVIDANGCHVMRAQDLAATLRKSMQQPESAHYVQWYDDPAFSFQPTERDEEIGDHDAEVEFNTDAFGSGPAL